MATSVAVPVVTTWARPSSPGFAHALARRRPQPAPSQLHAAFLPLRASWGWRWGGSAPPGRSVSLVRQRARSRPASQAAAVIWASSDFNTGDIMSKYSGSGSSLPPTKSAAKGVGDYVPIGTLSILLLNIGIYVLDHLLHLAPVKTFYLYHANPQWFQFVTSTFCHANWQHLSNNIFFVYIFGKLIEEEEGTLGVWLSYLITGVGASVVSYFLLPKVSGGTGLLGALAGHAQTVSLGASGAVFGLFAISVLVKLSHGFNLWKLIESFILGQFVVERFMSEVKMQAASAGGAMAAGGVNHIAHLAGAMVGVFLVFLLSRIPPSKE